MEKYKQNFYSGNGVVAYVSDDNTSYSRHNIFFLCENWLLDMVNQMRAKKVVAEIPPHITSAFAECVFKDINGEEVETYLDVLWDSNFDDRDFVKQILLEKVKDEELKKVIKECNGLQLDVTDEGKLFLYGFSSYENIKQFAEEHSLDLAIFEEYACHWSECSKNVNYGLRYFVDDFTDICDNPFLIRDMKDVMDLKFDFIDAFEMQPSDFDTQFLYRNLTLIKMVEDAIEMDAFKQTPEMLYVVDGDKLKFITQEPLNEYDCATLQTNRGQRVIGCVLD